MANTLPLRNKRQKQNLANALGINSDALESVLAAIRAGRAEVWQGSGISPEQALENIARGLRATSDAIQAGIDG
jgi:hypothetical protein